MKTLKKIFYVMVVFMATALLFKGCQKDPIALYPNEYNVYTHGKGGVGSAGGIVMVDDENSPLHGVAVEIPEGALDSMVEIKISLAPDDIENPADSTALMIKFEPSRLVFQKPVTISIPYHNISDTIGLNIFHFDADSVAYTQMPKKKIDVVNNIIVGETMHFSYYTAFDNRAKIDIEMLKIGNKIGVRLKLNNLHIIRTMRDICRNHGWCNVWRVIKNSRFYDKSVFRVRLYRQRTLWIDDHIETKNYYIWRRTHGDGADALVCIGYDHETSEIVYATQNNLSSSDHNSELAMWNSGEPLVFYFDDFQPDPNHNYFVRIKWFHSKMPVQNIFGRSTPLYEFDNKEVSMKHSEMTPFPVSQLHESNAIDISYIDGDGPQPTVTTAPVTNITQTSAMGGGNVTHTGSTPVDAHGLVWSTNENPTIGNSEGANVIGTGTGEFTGGILNLTPNTVYYVRAYATNSGGTGYGSNVEFKTLGEVDDDAPLAPSNVYAGDWSSQQGFGVYWNDNSDNETGFRIYKSTSSLTNLQEYGTAPANTTFFEDNNSNPDDFHVYRVTAYNNDGESVMSNLAVVPKRPVNVSGQIEGCNITIFWDYPANSQAQRVYLSRSTSPSGVFSSIGLVNYPATSIADASAEPGVDYYFKVHSSWTGEATYNSRSIPTDVIGPFSVDDDNGNDDIIYGEGVTDIDGNFYPSVIIGNQEWMAENLRVTKYNNGDAIPTGLSNTEWQNTNEGAYAIYDFNHWSAEGINSPEEMVAAYGKLYNGHAVIDTRGLCPNGWHLPSHDEWTQLEQFICNEIGNTNCAAQFPYNTTTTGMRGTNESNAIKSCRQVSSPLGCACSTSEHPRWDDNNFEVYGYDKFGFSALPGGWRHHSGNFYTMGANTNYWSSTVVLNEDNEYRIWGRTMSNFQSLVGRYQSIYIMGLSVRCVRNND